MKLSASQHKHQHNQEGTHHCAGRAGQYLCYGSCVGVAEQNMDYSKASDRIELHYFILLDSIIKSNHIIAVNFQAPEQVD